MKRIVLLFAIAFAIVVSVQAQIPDPGDPVCAYCEVDLKSNQPHKRGCPYYEEPSSESSSSSSSSSSSTTSKPSRPFNERTDVPLDYYGNNLYRCPKCGQLNHSSDYCSLAKTQRDYRYWENKVWSTKKKKELQEAIKQRDRAWSLLKWDVKNAWEDYDRRHQYSSSSSSSSSSSTPTPSTSLERIQIPYECELCKARVMAYNFNDALRQFANNPWIHKPTCPKYKPKPGQNPSTSLKDYTPAQEHPMVSEPLMDMPVRQPAPQFSSINETNIRHEKPVSIIGKHEWGEISEESLSAFESLMGEEIPREFDIERYNHDKGTVILGTHKDNGRYHWTILCPQPDGSRTLISQEELKGGFLYGSQNVGELRDVHFEGQGTFIIAEYTSGFRQVYDKTGKHFRDGYNIKVLGSMVDGKRLLYVGKDEDTLVNLIFDEDGEVIVDGDDIEQYDDAIIARNGNDCHLSNWKGDLLEIGNINTFEDIKAFNNQGSYYILKDWNKGYAIIGRGFIRYGGWYDTEEEAHRAWRDYHP